MFTENELKWLGEVLNEEDRDPLEVTRLGQSL